MQAPWARWGDWRRKPEEVDLAHVLLAVHAVMQGKADQKRVDFRTVLPAPSSRRLAPVVMHAQQWERWLMEMLLNLSNNALRHARGRAELMIPEAQSVEDGQLRFEVHRTSRWGRSRSLVLSHARTHYVPTHTFTRTHTPTTHTQGARRR